MSTEIDIRREERQDDELWLSYSLLIALNHVVNFLRQYANLIYQPNLPTKSGSQIYQSARVALK
jgi:hypothetical protein